MLNEIGRKGNILDFSTWSQTNTGSAPGFHRNGSNAESKRVIAKGPNGNDILVWEARPDSASGPDGGWNSDEFNIDNTKLYRFSVWIKRSVVGNGSYYLGTRGLGGDHVRNASSGGASSNPYFLSGDWTYGEDEWVLIVGHVHPAGTNTGVMHHDSGVYDTTGGKIRNISLDYIWGNNTTRSLHRTYLYYSTNTNTRQQFCHPRVDVCDGTEPTIADLIHGVDERYELANFPNNFAMSSKGLIVNDISEVGVIKGVSSYFPLSKDIKNYGSTITAVSTGDNKFKGGGANSNGYRYFNGNEDDIYVDNIGPASENFTVIAYVNYDKNHTTVTGTENHYGYFTRGNLEIAVHEYNDIRVRWGGTILWSNTASSKQQSSPFTWGDWATVAVVYNNGVLKVSHNGKDVWRKTVSRKDTSITKLGGGFRGGLCGLKILERALSNEELSIEHNYNSGGLTMSICKDTAYLSGEVRER